jgi:hypothetical protein
MANNNICSECGMDLSPMIKILGYPDVVMALHLRFHKMNDLENKRAKVGHAILKIKDSDVFSKVNLSFTALEKSFDEVIQSNDEITRLMLR